MNYMQIKEIQKNVGASLEVENKKASDEAIEINFRFLNGEITSNQAIKQIKEVYGL